MYSLSYFTIHCDSIKMLRLKMEGVTYIVVKINVCRKIALCMKYLPFIVERALNVMVVNHWHAFA